MNRTSLAALGLLILAPLLLSVWLLDGGARRVSLQIRPATTSTVQATRAPVPQTPVVRVDVSGGPASSIQIEISEPFEIRPVGSTRTLHQAALLERTAVTATPRGLRIGKQEFPASRLEIVPRKSPAVWVGTHQYRGTVRLFRQAGGKVLAVNVLPLEEYVASVIDSEMPVEFSPEARAAQAIVARTFALYQLQAAGADSLADLSATTRSQKYLGFQYRSDSGRLLAGESEDSRRLAAETQGMVCLHAGKLFCTYYCAACGGNTLVGTEMFPDAAPPLQSVPCDWCQPARLYRWTAEVTKTEMQSDLRQFLAQQGTSLGTLKSLRPVGQPIPGRLPQFAARDERQTYPLSGADLRRALPTRGVNSPNFTIEDRGNTFFLSGKGHGHGAGLCQWGARGQAQAGKTRLQIIAHYYPGAKVVIVEQ